jgi:beta-galactosidase
MASAYYKDDRDQMNAVTDTLTTASSAVALAMHPDRKQVAAMSGQVVHITTKALDQKGTLNPHSEQMVNYQLKGPGKIRVIDNGDLADHTAPGTPSRKLRKGKQLLILQAGSEPGDLIISATAEGLKSSSVKIKTKE